MTAIFEDAKWQMTLGERAALEGILTQVSPNLAVEVGTAEGGSLRRIAAHSREVHSFDMAVPAGAEKFANVHFHAGDSHTLLRTWLDQVTNEAREIDFALVDGDHTAAGVRADIQDILDSGALNGVLLFHDTMNPVVRKGVRQVDFRRCPNLRYLDLDLVPGHVGTYASGFPAELWGGLGIAVVGDAPATDVFALFVSGGIEQDMHYTTRLCGQPPRSSASRPGQRACSGEAALGAR